MKHRRTDSRAAFGVSIALIFGYGALTAALPPTPAASQPAAGFVDRPATPSEDTLAVTAKADADAAEGFARRVN